MQNRANIILKRLHLLYRFLWPGSVLVYMGILFSRHPDGYCNIWQKRDINLALESSGCLSVIIRYAAFMKICDHEVHDVRAWMLSIELSCQCLHMLFLLQPEINYLRVHNKSATCVYVSPSFSCSLTAILISFEVQVIAEQICHLK